MKLTDALLGEHGAFNVLLNEIEKMASIAGDVAQIDSAIAVFATEIKAHAALEEELLFPALKPHLATNELITEMLAEHKEIRQGLERIENAVDISEAIDAVQQTISAIRNHFQKEEKVLYPFAEDVLDDETLIRLGKAWAVARSMTIK